MATIQFSHISKSFSAGTDAVKNFNLDVSDGEFLVIVGSSGCGKSTVLRMVAGWKKLLPESSKSTARLSMNWNLKIGMSLWFFKTMHSSLI